MARQAYQAQIIPPGTFRISLLFNVLNTLEYLPLVTVPQGFYGRVVARDGAPLPAGQIMADAWPEKDFQNFLDAEYFLTHGGQKGLQLSVLKPGVYPLNLALFEVKLGYTKNGKDSVRNNDDVYSLNGLTNEDTPLDTSITRVPAGSVGVVRSSVQSKDLDCATITAKTDTDGLEADLVPQGCKGIWAASLPPNDYYLNRDAYDVTLVSTRVTALEFKGGFTRRYIDLKVDSRGDFTQSERTQSFPKPNDSADSAINTKIEGWEIQQELRAVVQITPEHAPIVVAAVGGQAEVDERIVVPSIRSHVRNVYGGVIKVEQTDEKARSRRSVTRPNTRVLDTIEQRLVPRERQSSKRMQIDGRRAGVDVKEIWLGEFGHPTRVAASPPARTARRSVEACLYPGSRRRKSNVRRPSKPVPPLINRAISVTAQIGVQTATLLQDKRAAEGRAERLFLEEQAAGQTAQANVLGKDSVLRLQQMKLVIDLLAAHPDILKNFNLPHVYVAGGGSGLEGAAAIFGGIMQQGAAAASGEVVKR